MIQVLTTAQMRAIEQTAISSDAVDGRTLMFLAGQGVVRACLARWPRLSQGPKRAKVLCGPGNNGGDGYVIAVTLLDLGWEVEVSAPWGAENLPADAAYFHDLWVTQRVAGPKKAEDWRGYDLIVDAMFGIGLSRPVDLPAVVADAFPPEDERPHTKRPMVVAVDVPTGLCADRGIVLGGGAGCWADLTVTFHRLKPGHLLADGPDRCGAVEIVDIGISGEVAGLPLQQVAVVPASFAKAQGHKFDHGHCIVLAGGAGYGGAARLAARAALRVGAGLVTLVCPDAAVAENASRLDAVMVRSVDGPKALRRMLADRRIGAVVVGPGFGLGQWQVAMIDAALASRIPCVLDADALTLIGRSPELRGKLHDACVLTPHGGEFARLVPELSQPRKGIAGQAAQTPAAKWSQAHQAAQTLGATVLYKGADTVIATGKEVALHAAAYGRAAPWLATAGSGDVLAGLIGGLMARGFSGFDAAKHASWLHTEAALSFGPGLMSEDLPDQIPAVFRQLRIG